MESQDVPIFQTHFSRMHCKGLAMGCFKSVPLKETYSYYLLQYHFPFPKAYSEFGLLLSISYGGLYVCPARARCLPLVPYNFFFFWDKVFHWNWAHQLDRLEELQAPRIFLFPFWPTLGYKHPLPHRAFYMTMEVLIHTQQTRYQWSHLLRPLYHTVKEKRFILTKLPLSYCQKESSYNIILNS